MTGQFGRGRGRSRGSFGGELTERRLLAVAEGEFGRIGFDATTFQGIADRIGITRPSINYHFASKADLFATVVADTDIRRRHALRALKSQGPRSTVRAEISELLKAVTTGCQDEPGAPFLLSATLDARRHPELPAPDLQPINTHLRDVLRRGVDRGELCAETDMASVSAVVVALMFGMGLHALLWRDEAAVPAAPHLGGDRYLGNDVSALLSGLPWRP